jgi:hypothetical protein
LNRADVEWLLATHENGHGPVDWNEEQQRRRHGLDLRGADLDQVDLRKLPLARLYGSLDSDEWLEATEQQLAMAAISMKGASLEQTHLEGAHLRGADLDGADLRFTFLERTHLRNASLKDADLRDAYLGTTRLENVVLSDERRIGPRLADIKWGDCNLAVVKWSQIDILGDEREALQKMHAGKLKSRVASRKEYEQAVRANRQLAIVLQMQGLNEDATRFAYRAQVLQKRVWWFQMTQHGMKLRQRMYVFGPWLFSWFLFLLAGYGYRLWRSFLAYALVIIGFMTMYYVLGASFKPPLSLVNALGLSMTSFHGRGFFPGVTQLNDTLTILASVEAFVGLILEATFIATLTQRFFGK